MYAEFVKFGGSTDVKFLHLFCVMWVCICKTTNTIILRDQTVTSIYQTFKKEVKIIAVLKSIQTAFIVNEKW